MPNVYVGSVNQAPRNADVVLGPEGDLFTGSKDFEQHFGTPTSVESDLLRIASSVFAADRAVKRGERELFARRFELSVPIVNIGRLEPLREALERALRFLSRDDWRIVYRHIAGQPEDDQPIECGQGTTLLLSGGLDSLAAAIELGRERRSAQLVSHITRNTVARNAQREIVRILAASGFQMPHYQFFVSSQDHARNPTHDEESSQRTRSFLFLVLAALAARRSRHSKVVWLAENGHMAIHLPLVPARVGAFSTHTANPEFISAMEGLLQGVLSAAISIENPFVYRTKAEIVALIRAVVPAAIGVTVSCWRSPRTGLQAAHCGGCIPCFIRRIAIEYQGTDATNYASDPWNQRLEDQPGDEVGRRNLVDLGIFVQEVERATDDEMMHQWPELFAPRTDAAEAIAMYRRFVGEARTVLARYPSIAAVLQ
jgi:7-cyano-7-deazaguanine synthase in queuosine biosynthesis